MVYHISGIDPGDSVDLRKARGLLLDGVTHDHIHLYRQSIFRPNDPRPAHWEVLVRIEDERGRMHRPADFLDQSERLDFAHTLDTIIVNESMRRWRSHSDAGLAVPITVNLSAQTADAGMAEHVIECAAHWDVPHHQVTLEIPSSTVIGNQPAATAFIGMLSAAGFQVALDGFDGGAALLSLTEELDFDFVKLDGSLSQRTLTNPVYRDYVGSLISLAHAHGLDVVAQFVESDELLNVLSELEADFVQGNHLGMPEEFPLDPANEPQPQPGEEVRASMP